MAIFALGALLGTELPGSVSPLIRKMSLLTREGAPFFLVSARIRNRKRTKTRMRNRLVN